MNEGLASISGVGASVDVPLLFESLNGGSDGSAGEADAVTECLDGLRAEVMEDFKEGEIGLGAESGFAEV